MGLRILHSLTSVDPTLGGPVEGVRQLSTMNTRLGHEVEIVSLDRPDSPWLDSMGVKVHAVGTARGAGTEYRYSPHFVPWLKRHAGEFDCVIVNGIWTFNSFGAWLALRQSKVPYFVFTHGMLDPWSKFRYPLKHLKKWLYWPWGIYPSLRDARAVFFTCEEERRLARQSFWLYDCHEFVVRYGTAGIPPGMENAGEEFLTAHPALRGKRLFVFLGRVHPKKGPDLLLRAVATLWAAGHWDRATMRIVMAGPVDGPYAAELKRLGEELGVAADVYWTGMLLGAQKWGALQTAEAFVLPSHQENFGLAAAESLSTGTPILLGKGVNIWPEVVADGAGLAESDDAPGCARMLQQWLELSAEERGQMRVRARKCFEERYTAESAANTLLAALYLLLATHEMPAKGEKQL